MDVMSGFQVVKADGPVGCKFGYVETLNSAAQGGRGVVRHGKRDWLITRPGRPPGGAGEMRQRSRRFDPSFDPCLLIRRRVN